MCAANGINPCTCLSNAGNSKSMHVLQKVAKLTYAMPLLLALLTYCPTFTVITIPLLLLTNKNLMCVGDCVLDKRFAYVDAWQ